MSDAATNEKIISLGTLSHNNDKMKEYIQNEIDKIPSSAVDDSLSDTSEHPVQNKVITASLNNKANLTDIPTSLPANGGNADTVGNISATNLVRTLGVISDTDFLNNAAFYEYSYEASINATTASAIGLPAKFYIIKGFQFVNNGKYAVQIAYPRNHTGQAMIRYANGTDWTSWKGLGDGCNADTVDGKHATEFFPKSDLSHSFALGTNPSANESKLMAFCDSTGSTSKLLGWLAHTQYADGTSAIGIVVRNNVVSGQTLFGVTVRISEDGKTYYATTMTPSSPSLSALRNIASGTAAATMSNCPNGCWYGQHS